MKVTVAAVISLDGKLTRHDETDISPWVSKEDHLHFTSLIKRSPAIVLGSTTYEAMKASIKLSPGKLRVVLTTRPEDYSDQVVEGQLEFKAATPTEFINDMESRGIEDVLVVGGERMIAEFLQAGVVSEMHITVEPKLFGTGKSLVANVPLDVKLKLLEQTTLNKNGTQLLRYEILSA